jgi:hypothetical protein
MDDHSQDEGDLDGGQCCRRRRSLRFAHRWSLVRDRRDESQLYQQDHVEEFRMCLGGDVYLVRESFRNRKVIGWARLKFRTVISDHEPFPDGQARLVSSIVRSGLALFRDSLLYLDRSVRSE